MKMLCISLTRPALFPRSAASKTSVFQSINLSRHREAHNWKPTSQPHKYPITASIPREVMMSASGADVGSSVRSVVVAVDETKESVNALQWTLDNFYKEGDVVHLLHVIPYIHQQVLTSTVYYSPPVVDPEITEQLYANAREVVDEKFVPVLNERKAKYEVDMIKEKSSETIGDAVCHFAADLKACAVVVAAHKKHWLQKWLMGSSSAEIAGKAPLPVIVYHG